MGLLLFRPSDFGTPTNSPPPPPPPPPPPVVGSLNTQVFNPWAETVTVTSVRTAGNVGVTIPNALVARLGAKEAANSNGVYQSGDIRCELGLSALAAFGEEAKPRDTIAWKNATYVVYEVGGDDWLQFRYLMARNPVIAADLQQFGTFRRDTSVPAAGGTRVPIWTPYAASVPCRLQEVGRQAEQNDSTGGRTVRIRYSLYVSSGQQIQAGDQVQIASGPTLTVTGSEGYDQLGIFETITCEGFF